MPQPRPLPVRLIALLPLVLLAGCGGGVPDVFGREGSGAEGVYALRGEAEALPEPVPVPMAALTVEPALNGTIIRVDSVVPTQGYHSARLIAQANGEPDDTGTVGFVLTAIPPEGAEAIGPARTRTLRAAVFVPNRAKRQVKSVRILDATGVRTVPLR